MKKDRTPKIPRLPNWLASKFINENLIEEFFGDLNEIYVERVSAKGRFYGRLMYWVDVLHLIIGFSSIKIFKFQNNPAVMYRHYLTVSVRNIFRSKVYSTINILSLAIGMGVFFTICQYIYFEFSYDNFHNNFQNTYRVAIDRIKSKGDPYPYPYETGYAVGITAKTEVPGINQFVRLHNYSGGAVVANSEQNKIFTEEAMDIFFVDNSFLDMFKFPLNQGKVETAFNDKYSIVITEKTALKYFGTENPMGKFLTLSGGVSPGNYMVTGILEPLPLNSHLQFNFLLPIENYMEYGWGGAATKNDDGWSSPDMTTYVRIDESADINSITEKLNQLINNHNKERNAQEGITENLRLQPIADIHLKSDPTVDQGMVRNNGQIQNIKFFAIIAFFILVIAWVNNINLSTAHAIRRAKEVGIRKSIGAFKKQLIGQFMIESLFVNAISAVLAIGTASLALPTVGDILKQEFEFSLIGVPMFWVLSSIMIILGSVLTGLFPAFILSSFKPISMLGAYKVPKPGNFSLRRGLITFQFIISLFLMSGTYLVYKQIKFMQTQKLGMDIEKILVLKGPEVNLNNANLESILQTFKEQVTDHHSISSVAASSSVPGKGYNTGLAIRKLGDPVSSEKFGRVVFAGFGLPETYNLEFLAGVSPSHNTTNGSIAPIIINEEAVQAFGLGSPENAIQEKLYFKGDTFTISGVVKNYHWHSLEEAHTSYLLEFYADCRSYFSIKVNLSDLEGSLAHIESVYNSFFPGNAFEYFFLEDEFNRQYQSDIQFGNLFFAFTVLAIFISCIGLFALISYSTLSRVREIGIRKIHGASVNNLMILLSKEYVLLLLVANGLAIPAIFYWGNTWLTNYAFRTSLNFNVFLLPLLALIVICLFTVSYRTFLAAKRNPLESLRTE
jgi:putative ABC transport system permease protein